MEIIIHLGHFQLIMGIMRSTAWTCVYSVGHPCGMATCFISSTLLQGSGFPSHIGWQSHPVPANCFAKANPMCFKGLLRPVNIPLFRDLPNPLLPRRQLPEEFVFLGVTSLSSASPSGNPSQWTPSHDIVWCACNNVGGANTKQCKFGTVGKKGHQKRMNE